MTCPFSTTFPPTPPSWWTGNQVGVNVGPDTAAQVAGMTVEDCLRMRENVRRVFDETFDLPVVQARYAALLRGIV